MSMQAIGAYIRGLRKGQGLTLLDASRLSANYTMTGKGVEPSYIKKIEDATLVTAPSVAHVIALVKALHGSLVVVGRLFVRPETPDTSERWGMRHAMFIAQDVEWMTDLTPEEQGLLRAMFEADEASER